MKIEKIIKGMDISTLPEEEECGAVYYDDGQQKDLFEILKKYGTDSIRLRIWNDPYDNGKKYGAGTNDFARTVELSKRAKEAGMTTLLDFHYSDFWADPGKQFPPKAWADYDADGLVRAVYEFTKETLEELKERDLLPYMVQVGNELTNGCCWPLGNRMYGKGQEQETPYFNPILKRILQAGIRAVREASREIIIMIHLDNGGNNELYRDWFDGYFGCRVKTETGNEIQASGDKETISEYYDDFDVIGLSYYPFWHGNLKALENNLKDIAVRYGKELVIAEVSMGFSMEDYRRYELPEADKSKNKTSDVDQLKGMATKQSLTEGLDYPMTPAGQEEFMKHLKRIISDVPGGLCRGYYYWEPAWIPVPGCGWATEASLGYIHDKGPCGNEWANQALFDYEGNVLPAMKI